ncbi:hypothetical protein [Vampirovibrio sp.]|uniref:hypothetical protein n=1 Tax=Vampirovibrio sp. TaxID=2717857 RepID=UPI00359344D6
MLSKISYPGNTTAEYGIVLGLLIGLGIYGLNVLGPAINGNLKEVAATQGTLSILSPLGSGSPGKSSAPKASSQPPEEASSHPAGNGGSGGASNPTLNIATPDATQVTPQVSGSNGSYVQAMTHNAGQLLNIAEKYKDKDPEVYEMIIKLGQQGQAVANAMNTSAGSASMQDEVISDSNSDMFVGMFSAMSASASIDFNQQSNDYRNFWGLTVKNSKDFQSMSPADQAIVRNLVESSNQAMESFRPVDSDAEQTAAQVNQDNEEIENCGRGGC